MTPHTEMVAVEYNGLHGEVESHFLECDVCGSQGGVKEMRQSKRNTIAFRKQALHLLTGQQVRAIREKLGLTQNEAARLFGGGPVAFSKYENDDIIQSESMDKLLRVAANNPEQVLPIIKNPTAYDEKSGNWQPAPKQDALEGKATTAIESTKYENSPDTWETEDKIA